MKKLNEKGFGAVGLVLILVVVGLISTAGWVVWNRNQDKSQKSNTDNNETTAADHESSSDKSYNIKEDSYYEEFVSKNKIMNLGEPASYKDFSVKVLGLLLNPSTKGDAPDEGMKYIAFNMVLANTGNENSFVDGDFTYKRVDGKEVTVPLHPVGQNADPNNQGQSLVGVTEIPNFLDAGESADCYILFQVPIDDSGAGKIVWHSKTHDVDSPIYAVFNTQ